MAKAIRDFVSHTMAAVAYHGGELQNGDVFTVNGVWHKIAEQEEHICEKCSR